MNPAIDNSPTCSEILGHFAAALKYDAVPAPLMQKLKLHLLDTLGVGLAFSTEPLARELLDMAAADAEVAACSLFGTTQRSSPRTAALVNGAMMQGFDFDGIHRDTLTHPCAAVLPAVLALAQAQRVDGRTALVALAAGVEVCIRIAASGAAAMVRNGVAPLSACGALGAAVAAARVLCLSGNQTMLAIGAASSFAAGSHEWTSAPCNFRFISAGTAASAGVFAAQMAQRGFIGSRSALEGSKGFLNAFAGVGAYQLDTVVRDLGTYWMMSELVFKRYPVSDAALPYVEAAIDLHRKYQVSPDDIEKVIVRIDGAAARLAQPFDSGSDRPSVDAARFSVPYPVALALLDGAVRLADFDSDRSTAHIDVCAIAKRVHLENELGDGTRLRASGQVCIHTRDGRQLSSNAVIAQQQPVHEMSYAGGWEARQIISKFRDCTTQLSADAQTTITERALALDTAGSLDETVPILTGVQS